MAKSKVSEGVTAFIDILGMSERLKSATNEAAILAIAQELKEIQRVFDFDSKDPLTKQVQASYSKKVLAFSDSIVIHLPMKSQMTKSQGTFDPFMSELADFGLNQGMLALDGTFIRGGIDLGYWYKSGSRLVSESLMYAYEAEGKAEMPILVLTKRLMDFFTGHDHRKFYAKRIEPVGTMFRKHTTAKGDTFYYIDYISVCLESLGWQTSMKQRQEYLESDSEKRQEIMNAGYTTNVVRWLTQHARLIEAAHAKAGNAQGKYEWLSKYHNEIASQYTQHPGTVCTV